MTRTELKRTRPGSLPHPAPHLRTQSRLRAGVTLIEILVVLAIIGVLIALTAAALQKTVEGQKVRSSESQVFKLQQALDQEYERVVTQAAQQVQSKNAPGLAEVSTVCEHDPARLKAVWTAFQLRLAFPDTFDDANASLVVKDAAGNIVATISPLPTFAPVRGLTNSTSAYPLEEESGALLLIILSKRSVSGGGAMATAADDLTEGTRRKAKFGARELETFSDAFQQSVGFKRWEQTIDGTLPFTPTSLYAPGLSPNVPKFPLQNPPYVDPAKSYATNPNANRDPLDPQDKVNPWLNAMPNTDQRKLMLLPQYLSFNRQNRVPTVYSLGRTKVDSANNPTPLNDILGFRLSKPGQRGYLQ